MNSSLVFYNLCDIYNISHRTIEKVISSGITVENIKNMSLDEFSNLYGVKKLDLFKTLKMFAQSNRCYNASKNPQLLFISVSALYHYGLSTKFIEKLQNNNIRSVYNVALLPKEMLKTYTGLSDLSVDKVIAAVGSANLIFSKENLEAYEIIARLDSNETYLELFKKEILLLMNSFSKEEISSSEISNLLPTCFKMSNKFNDVIESLIENKYIDSQNGFLIHHKYNLEEYLNAQPDSKSKTFMLEYLSGKTLEQIGAPYNITRERVRQILAKFKYDSLQEDEYLKYYQKYSIPEDIFVKIFNTTSMVYRYCLYRTKKAGTIPYREMLDDEDVSTNIKDLIKQTDDLFVYIDGNQLYKNMSEVLRYYMKKYCSSPVKESKIKNDFIKYWENITGEKFLFNISAFQHCLDNSKCIILSAASSWRYYDFNDELIDELIIGLDLEQYDGLEISTQIMYDDNQRLMRSLDIRSHYELHNILKKSHKLDSFVEFGRIPMLKIGKADRDSQILELIKELSPVNQQDLITEYCKRYGTKTNSTLSYIINNFGQYYLKGKFIIDLKVPSEEEILKWKPILKKDIYFFDELIKLARENNLEFERAYLKKDIISKFGYKSNSSYIYKDCYGSAMEYFDSLLVGDFLDLNNIDRNIQYLIAFSEELYKKLRNREYFEYESRKFISMTKLKELGVTNDDLDRFIAGALKYASDGSIFSIKSLKNLGFNDPLFNLGFDEMFYSSILRASDKFLFRRINSGNCLFRINTINYLLNIAKLIEEVLFKYRSMEIHKLSNYIENQYGIELDIYKIKELMKNTNLYCDDKNIIYYNYEEYRKKL